MITFFRKVILRHRLDEKVGTRRWRKDEKYLYAHNEKYMESGAIDCIFYMP